jgi:hypothetical protein
MANGFLYRQAVFAFDETVSGRQFPYSTDGREKYIYSVITQS